jgi:hypothetical protein
MSNTLRIQKSLTDPQILQPILNVLVAIGTRLKEDGILVVADKQKELPAA